MKKNTVPSYEERKRIVEAEEAKVKYQGKMHRAWVAMSDTHDTNAYLPDFNTTIKVHWKDIKA